MTPLPGVASIGDFDTRGFWRTLPGVLTAVAGLITGYDLTIRGTLHRT